MGKICKLWLFLLFFLGYSLFPINTIAQTYNDHFGTGQTIGLNVSSSDGQNINEASNSVSGTDLIPDLVGASRFLAQATLGASYEDIDYVSQIGIDAWLEEQFSMPAPSFAVQNRAIYDEVLSKIAAVHGVTDSTRRDGFINFVFYQKLFTDQDQLRQKVAFALSQILVISPRNTSLNNRCFAVSSYYDLLYQQAFGNFRSLLQDVTLHPAMGIYLSTFKNKKADPVAGTLPDENYAREVMQLFTIGLFEMNNDGTYKTDQNGDLIPTYNINDIQELSKVFTGLSGGDWDLVLNPENAGTPLTFSKGYNHYDLTVPMAMFEDNHDTGTKVMIDGSVIPAGQTGLEDIEDAIELLFNHSNTGPFISIRLIQQLVKSNPSPAYVNRVATVFNDNGQGVRGDLEAVVKAILVDPEAIDCSWIDDPQAGKLKQPVERFTNLFKAFDVQTPSGKFWFRDYIHMFEEVEQAFLGSPSVFNFFLPSYAEPEYVAPNNMVSPEFQILHSTSGIHYINLLESAIKTRPFKNRTGVNPDIPRLANDNDTDEPYLDLSDEINILDTQGISALIDRLDLILCHGQLSDDARLFIENAYFQNSTNIGSYTSDLAVRDAIYFMMVTPDYTILE